MHAEDHAEDPCFQQWLQKKSNRFTSPEIQNELLRDMGLMILRDVVSSIKNNSMFYSIMADESTDVTS